MIGHTSAFIIWAYECRRWAIHATAIIKSSTGNTSCALDITDPRTDWIKVRISTGCALVRACYSQLINVRSRTILQQTYCRIERGQDWQYCLNCCRHHLDLLTHIDSQVNIAHHNIRCRSPPRRVNKICNWESIDHILHVH